MVFALGPGWVASDMWVYEGTLAGIPTSGGNFDLTLFDHLEFSPSRSLYYNHHLIPTGSPLCNHYVAVLRLHRYNFFCQPIAYQTVYFTGAPIHKGFELEYCKFPCDSGIGSILCGSTSDPF